jgi:hypothetical protein
MSDFLLVVPPDWTKVDLEAACLISGVSIPAIESWIGSRYFDIMATELINGGVLPEGSIILEAQIFNGETFLVRLG